MSESKKVIRIDIGDMVLCDHCGEDYSDKDEIGGLIFQSSACCPKCEPRFMQVIKKYGEENFIRATCPPGVSFKDFIIGLR